MFGFAALFGATRAQVGRGGSEWLTAGGDAQRTSWIRTDAKISLDTMSKPGFELQWKARLDNAARRAQGIGQGVSANGVTLFIPMTVVAGSSNNVYALDNDTGYVVWQRHFDVPIPAPTAACAGGMTSAPTRVVGLTPPPIAPPPGGGRAAQSYRSVIGQPGEGAPVEVRGGAGAGARGARGAPVAPAAGAPAAGAPAAGAPAAGAPAAGAPPAAPPQRANNPTPPLAAIPGAKPEELGGGRGGLGRASGVVYTIASDGVLHVMGLPSGKDIQKPAEFVPANARWSDAIAVDTTLYTATLAGCGNTPNAVWAIDLQSEGKPVVSWKSGGSIVGTLAFTTGGTVIAAVGPGAGADGKPNAIVALDPKTLQVKDWFSVPSTEFATGPTIVRGSDGERELVAAATKDGRLVVLDAASLGGADHATPLASSAVGGSIAPGESLANWREMRIAPATDTVPPGPAAPPIVTYGTRWILAPLANAVAAFRVGERAGTLVLERGWSADALASPATPVIVNGVAFALASGRAASGSGAPAVLHAFDAASGKSLWTSGTSMTSAAAPGSFWSSFGQVYVGAADGTLYAFGFLDERR
ncbi:MAG TPA: hypothetical protein VGI12_01810 [Vicinamibacterales bacterium]